MGGAGLRCVMALRSVTLDALMIEDEASFAHVALYARLKRVVLASGHRFLVPDDETAVSWDRAVFLNLTFWNGADAADVLCEQSLAADVVAHIAWHHVAALELAADAEGPTPAEALFFGESIASAFDLYLVGRLLSNVPDSDFIATQVPIMREAAENAGMDDDEFTALLQGVSDDPERAFESLRSLLFDAARALYRCKDAAAAHQVLEGFANHRFFALLHHYQLSNWVLYARAYAGANDAVVQRATRIDASLRAAPNAVDWLEKHWLR